MSLYRDTYRVETARLAAWDYTMPAWYFVTICTKDRVCRFGEVDRDGAMRWSPEGAIVAEEWQRTQAVRPYVALDAWVVMPNHVHGLLGIRSDTPAVHDGDDIAVETSRRDVSTHGSSRLKPHSLGSIIGQFKSVCTKRIRRAGYADFAWQPRFYDHIVRNERAFYAIRHYILNNPARWQADRLYPDI